MLHSIQAGDVDPIQTKQMKKYFHDHVFDQLKDLVISKMDNRSQSDQCKFMRYLTLDDSMFQKIIEIAQITDIIEPYYSKDRETFVYYVLNGYVDVYNSSESQILTQMDMRRVFYINPEVNKRRKYRGVKDGPESVHFGDPTRVLGLLRFKLNQLVDVFEDELKLNLINNKSSLINFKLFNCLAPEELGYLARRVLKAEYFDDEVILEEGAAPVDKFYLIIQGQVKMASSARKEEAILDTFEYFGLKEMLVENCGGRGYPAKHQFSAYECTREPAQIMAIHVSDFLKVMPPTEVQKLMEQYQVNKLLANANDIKAS